jgi:hypothetical protein
MGIMIRVDTTYVDDPLEACDEMCQLANRTLIPVVGVIEDVELVAYPTWSSANDLVESLRHTQSLRRQCSIQKDINEKPQETEKSLQTSSADKTSRS